MVEHNRHQIRRAQPEDSPALVELVKRGIPGYPFESVYDTEAVRQSLVSPSDYRVVCLDSDSRIIGTAVLGDAGDYMQEIKRVVVDPALRRNGVASEITTHLVGVARESQVVPWMDARADQLGMQKAGLKAGLKALSLESGKHCVYFHLDNDGVQIGAGRETMVHITSLTPDLRELTDLLSLWPLELVETLVANMEKAYAPQTKNIKAVEERIPTAAIVKQRIETKIEEAVKNGIQVLTLPNPDLSIITLNDTQLLVVKPDASGFVLSDASSELPAMVQLGHALGLQVITVYIAKRRYAAGNGEAEPEKRQGKGRMASWLALHGKSL